MGNANPANTTFLRWLSLLIISLLSLPADAQSGNGDYDTYTTWSEFVTEYLEQNIDEDALEAESDLRQDLQFMEDLHLRPQNINTAAKEDILRLAFMTEAQADSILSYRCRKREFFSLGELQFVSGLTPVQRKWLSLFSTQKESTADAPTLRKGKTDTYSLPILTFPFTSELEIDNTQKKSIRKIRTACIGETHLPIPFAIVSPTESSSAPAPRCRRTPESPSRAAAIIPTTTFLPMHTSSPQTANGRHGWAISTFDQIMV